MSVRPIRPDDVPAVVGLVRELADYEKALHEVRLTDHPKAARQIELARGWGAITAFLLTAWLSHRAGVPAFDSGLRALVDFAARDQGPTTRRAASPPRRCGCRPGRAGRAPR